MSADAKHTTDVEAYIAASPAESRARLKMLRKVVRSAAPHAEETISYGMPFYKYRGARVSFTLFKKHIGLFGVSSVLKEHQRELTGYPQSTKGAIRFPLDKPLPASLIGKLVKARMNGDRRTARRHLSGYRSVRGKQKNQEGNDCRCDS